MECWVGRGGRQEEGVVEACVGGVAPDVPAEVLGLVECLEALFGRGCTLRL